MYYDLYYDTIAKARDYSHSADENFVYLSSNHVHFNGTHGTHTLKFENGHWICDCRTFKLRSTVQKPHFAGVCAHVVAIEMLCREYLGNECK